jgi:hypothetical protein
MTSNQGPGTWNQGKTGETKRLRDKETEERIL